MLARRRAGGDGDLDIAAGHRLAQRGQVRATGRGATSGKLVGIHRLQRDQPARTGVLERVDLHLEEACLRPDADDMHRCAARIQQPAPIPGDQVAQPTGDKLAVGRGIRIRLVHARCHAATMPRTPPRCTTRATGRPKNARIRRTQPERGIRERRPCR